jgi:lysophospholipase L1-like esterase
MLTRSLLSRWPTPRIALLVTVLVACESGGAESTTEPFGHDPNGPQDIPPAGSGDGATMRPGAGGGAATIDGGAAPAAVPEVQLIGRFDTRDAAGPKCAWPGCRIVARFEGTRVSVRLREELQPWMDGGPSEWDVAVDGHWQPKIVMAASGTAQDYVIADGLADAPHVVELYKRSEAQNGTTQFLGYDFGGGKLLVPPPRSARRLEIIGDSVASGYGVEGVGLGPACPGPNYAARYENFHESMGALLGAAFGAEVAGTVFAGKGIARNVWTDDKETMPVLFMRALPVDETSTWQFSKFVADVVIVMLGGNDFAIGQPVDHGPASAAEFTSAYSTFTAVLRQRYPSAHLFLTVPPPLTDLDPPGTNTRTNVVAAVKSVAAQRNSSGDPKVHAFEPKPGDESEHTGCEGHGSPQFHQRVAAELAVEVASKVGWN